MTNDYIYSITNLVNGRRYIGNTDRLRTRCQCHRSALKTGKHHVADLQRDWDEMGEDAFRFERIATCPANVSGNEEAAWMARFARDGVCLYNSRHAAAHAEKMSLVPTGVLPNPPDVVNLKVRKQNYRTALRQGLAVRF